MVLGPPFTRRALGIRYVLGRVREGERQSVRPRGPQAASEGLPGEAGFTTLSGWRRKTSEGGWELRGAECTMSPAWTAGARG